MECIRGALASSESARWGQVATPVELSRHCARLEPAPLILGTHCRRLGPQQTVERQAFSDRLFITRPNRFKFKSDFTGRKPRFPIVFCWRWHTDICGETKLASSGNRTQVPHSTAAWCKLLAAQAPPIQTSYVRKVFSWLSWLFLKEKVLFTIWRFALKTVQKCKQLFHIYSLDDVLNILNSITISYCSKLFVFLAFKYPLG